MRTHRLLIISALLVATSSTSPSPTFADGLKTAWSSQVGHIENVVPAGASIYYSTGSAVGAIDARTGKVRWQKGVGPLYWRPAIAYGDGVVYADQSGSILIAYSGANGAKIWSRPLASDYSHPLGVHGGLLYCQADRHVMAAIDTKTHKTRWKIDLALGGSENAFNLDNPPVFLPSGNAIVTVSEHPDSDSADRTLQVLSISSSGKVEWRRKIPMTGAAWFEQVELTGNTLYASIRRERLIAVDITSGKTRWDVPIPCDNFAVTGQEVLVTGHGSVRALDATSGHSGWQTRLVSAPHVDLTGPVATGSDALVFTSAPDVSQAVWLEGGTTVRKCELMATHLNGPVRPIETGYLVAGDFALYRFVPGAPTPLPSTATARAKLASDLVARFDKLNEEEQFTLVHLGDDAVPAILELLHDRAVKEDNADAVMDDRDRFQSVYKIASRMMRPEYTAAVVDLVRTLTPNTEPLSAYADILRLLSAKGDDSLTVPLFIDVAKAGSVPGLPGPFETAMSVLKHSTDPAAVDFLMSHLNDSDGDIRETAYRSLARTGGDAGVDAVRKLQRLLPDVDTDKQKVIASTIEAHYHFKDTNPMPVTVEAPDGVASFATPAFDYITVSEYGVHQDYGIHVARFTPPTTDFDGAVYYPETKSPFLWNSDKTQVKLALVIHYDDRLFSTYDVTLRKFGNDWLVVDYTEIEQD